MLATSLTALLYYVQKRWLTLTRQNVFVSVLFSVHIFFSFLARVLGLLLQRIAKRLQRLKKKLFVNFDFFELIKSVSQQINTVNV